MISSLSEPDTTTQTPKNPDLHKMHDFYSQIASLNKRTTLDILPQLKQWDSLCAFGILTSNSTKVYYDGNV